MESERDGSGRTLRFELPMPVTMDAEFAACPGIGILVNLFVVGRSAVPLVRCGQDARPLREQNQTGNQEMGECDPHESHEGYV